jgi:dihydroorotate dehydrogenase (fumarate)
MLIKRERKMLDLSTNYLGLKLKNPLVPSSSPLSRQLDPILHLEDAGAAAIVMHSLFEEDLRNDERMIERFLIHPEAFGEAAGHLPGVRDYVSKLDAYLEQITQLKARLEIPVVASLNGSSLGGWVELGQEMQAAGADALELNAWYMPGDPEIPGESLEERYLGLLHELKEHVSIPVSMKLSPFFTSLPNFVRRAEQAGVAGVSLFNRFFQPDIDLTTLKIVDRVQLSSSADTLLTMRWIAILCGRCRLTLAASGSVHTADDALKMLLAGADVVHMASALLQGGPTVLKDVLDGIARWMEKGEYISVAQLKGSMSQKNLPDPSAFARAAYLKALDSFTSPAGVMY